MPNHIVELLDGIATVFHQIPRLICGIDDRGICGQCILVGNQIRHGVRGRFRHVGDVGNVR